MPRVRKAGNIPGREDEGAGEVRQVYEHVGEAIKMGEELFPRGATSGDKSMKGYHSVWKETHGVCQTNTMLRGSEEVEYEVFVGADAADGLREAWKRPMHWAGFLAMGASTRLPRGSAGEPGDADGRGG